MILPLQEYRLLKQILEHADKVVIVSKDGKQIAYYTKPKHKGEKK